MADRRRQRASQDSEDDSDSAASDSGDSAASAARSRSGSASPRPSHRPPRGVAGALSAGPRGRGADSAAGGGAAKSAPQSECVSGAGGGGASGGLRAPQRRGGGGAAPRGAPRPSCPTVGPRGALPVSPPRCAGAARCSVPVGRSGAERRFPGAVWDGGRCPPPRSATAPFSLCRKARTASKATVSNGAVTAGVHSACGGKRGRKRPFL